jgi:hypothetical protein
MVIPRWRFQKVLALRLIEVGSGDSKLQSARLRISRVNLVVSSPSGLVFPGEMHDISIVNLAPSRVSDRSGEDALRFRVETLILPA